LSIFRHGKQFSSAFKSQPFLPHQMKTNYLFVAAAAAVGAAAVYLLKKKSQRGGEILPSAAKALSRTREVQSTTPVSAVMPPPFTVLRRGEITSQVVVARNYYLDPSNTTGTFEQRKEALAREVRGIFSRFLNKRRQEYRAAICHYRGVDWNQAGNSSWRSMTCYPGMQFDMSTLKCTQNGDMKEGPNLSPDGTTISWKTGGHSYSKTFVEIDAIYPQHNIFGFSLYELNQARQVLTEQGIYTEPIEQ
jgi:hypothetical protein